MNLEADFSDSVGDEAADHADHELTEERLRYQREIDRIQQIPDAHPDRSGEAAQRAADRKGRENNDGIPQVNGGHVRSDRDLYLKEGEDRIGECRTECT